MKGLTLTQPWASLIAAGLKTVETRPKITNYRGPIAIHGAKTFRAEDHNTFKSGRPGLLELCTRPHLAEPLESVGLAPASLPMGSIVAVADLVDCLRDEIGSTARVRAMEHAARNGSTRFEEQLGDYGQGRCYWLLENVRAIEPVSARGALYLFDLPDDLA